MEKIYETQLAIKMFKHFGFENGFNLIALGQTFALTVCLMSDRRIR